ncbi:predicted protein [Lodderomyces elongisporus NRRL YB-4239]|uniref:Uncharacterized protein n=1 Tax=Lodderomyces elongisporus (strain ATCC 11503 / CBS 2605 / JCM 1781 / NBRC 1676 / NRRL YB-4239) TaxID=379508 RepID=A5E7N2_LODEL|nr:predicted protein [Lodderomyces elongisporus NRRL YB-4239]
MVEISDDKAGVFAVFEVDVFECDFGVRGVPVTALMLLLLLATATAPVLTVFVFVDVDVDVDVDIDGVFLLFAGDFLLFFSSTAPDSFSFNLRPGFGLGGKTQSFEVLITCGAGFIARWLLLVVVCGGCSRVVGAIGLAVVGFSTVAGPCELGEIDATSVIIEYKSIFAQD